MTRQTTVVTSGSLGRSENGQPYDPAGARTQDLRIKRCQADSLLYDGISTCDAQCDDGCEPVARGASGATIRRGSLRGHLRPLALGGGNTGVTT